jgi:ferredoxin
VIAASPSATAMDYAMCELVGASPLKVPTVRVAHERGIGPGTLPEVTLLGEPFDALRVTDFQQAPTRDNTMLPDWAARVSAWLFAPRPEIVAEECQRCGMCVMHCPASTIEGQPGVVPTIRHRRCIRCFCCHELCPSGAVHIMPSRVRIGRRRKP